MTRLCFIALLFLSIASADNYQWTDRGGRQVEGEFVSGDEEYFTMRRASDGKIFRMPIARLNDESQAFARAQIDAKAKKDAANSGASGKPFDGLEWPRRTDLPDDYEVVVVKEDSATREYIYRTLHFEFRSDVKLARKVVRDFGKIFEGTYVAMQAFPLEWNPQPKDGYYVTRLFESNQTYLEAGGLPNSAGVYSPSKREIWAPLSSLGVEKSSSSYTLDDSEDHSTLIHEITHQIHHDWLMTLPPWMVEGMAVYMESVPYYNGKFRFDRRELDEYLQAHYGSSSVIMVSLERLMTITHAEWVANFSQNPDELGTYYLSAFMLVNYFLHLDGEGEGRRIYAYCRALEAGKGDAEARALLLDGRSYAELAEELRRAYKREKVDVSVF